MICQRQLNTYLFNKIIEGSYFFCIDKILNLFHPPFPFVDKVDIFSFSLQFTFSFSSLLHDLGLNLNGFFVFT